MPPPPPPPPPFSSSNFPALQATAPASAPAPVACSPALDFGDFDDDNFLDIDFSQVDSLAASGLQKKHEDESRRLAQQQAEQERQALHAAAARRRTEETRLLGLLGPLLDVIVDRVRHSLETLHLTGRGARAAEPQDAVAAATVGVGVGGGGQQDAFGRYAAGDGLGGQLSKVIATAVARICGLMLGLSPVSKHKFAWRDAVKLAGLGTVRRLQLAQRRANVQFWATLLSPATFVGFNKLSALQPPSPSYPAASPSTLLSAAAAALSPSSVFPFCLQSPVRAEADEAEVACEALQVWLSGLLELQADVPDACLHLGRILAASPLLRPLFHPGTSPSSSSSSSSSSSLPSASAIQPPNITSATATPPAPVLAYPWCRWLQDLESLVAARAAVFGFLLRSAAELWASTTARTAPTQWPGLRGSLRRLFAGLPEVLDAAMEPLRQRPDLRDGHVAFGMEVLGTFLTHLTDVCWDNAQGQTSLLQGVIKRLFR
jgi:hypothetical protein